MKISVIWKEYTSGNRRNRKEEEKRGRKKKKGWIWRRGRERERRNWHGHKEMPFCTAGDILWRVSFIYLFIFLKNSKTTRNIPNSESCKEICYWSCEETAFMTAGNTEYCLLGRLGAASSSISLRYGNATATAKSIQSCPTLCDPIDGSPPGSPVPGILQARTLEWIAISFSNAGKWKVKVKSLSRVRPSATPWTAAFQAPLSMGFSRQKYWSGCHCLVQNMGIGPWKKGRIRFRCTESWL